MSGIDGYLVTPYTVLLFSQMASCGFSRPTAWASA